MRILVVYASDNLCHLSVDGRPIQTFGGGTVREVGENIRRILSLDGQHPDIGYSHECNLPQWKRSVLEKGIYGVPVLPSLVLG